MRKLSFAAISMALIVAALTMAAVTMAQPAAKPTHYVVIVRPGPKWIRGKSASEQALLAHGRYLKEQMDKGTLVYAGPFLDDAGGLILLNVQTEADARRIAEHDPGVVEQILVPEIHPFLLAFDAATSKSPFK